MQGNCWIGPGANENQLVDTAAKAVGPTAFVDLGFGGFNFPPKHAQVVITRTLLPEVPNIRLVNQVVGQQLRTVLMPQPDLASQLVAMSLTNNLPEDSASKRLLAGLEVAINSGFYNLDRLDKDLRDQVLAAFFQNLIAVKGFNIGGAMTPGEAQLDATSEMVQRIARGEARELIDNGRTMAAEMRQINLWSRQGVGQGVITRHWHNYDPMEMFNDPRTGQEQLINCLSDPMDQSITVLFRRKIAGMNCAQELRRSFEGHKNEYNVTVSGGEIRGRAVGREFDTRDLGLVADRMSVIQDADRIRR